MALTVKVGAILTRESLSKPSRDPNRSTDPGIQLFDAGINVGNDLNTTAAGADDGHSLPGQIILLVPGGRVHQFALEVLEPIDRGPFPVACWVSVRNQS